jgi:hypothetical protein
MEIITPYDKIPRSSAAGFFISFNKIILSRYSLRRVDLSILPDRRSPGGHSAYETVETSCLKYAGVENEQVCQFGSCDSEIKAK